MQLDQIKKAYFLGIGGIGMSAIARYFNDKKIEVSGYDLTSTELTKTLEAEGMQIHHVDDARLIPEDIDIVVYTPAIPETLDEYQVIRQSGIPMMKRSEVLGMISTAYRTIAIAGTHGKTSTSTLIAYLMHAVDKPCLSFLGGIYKGWSGNYKYGDSGWMLAEADEYDRSFLQLYPEVGVVLSMDADHLDIYGTHQGMIDAYEQFTLQIKPGGTLILRAGLEQLFSDKWEEQIREKKILVITFGSESADVSVTHLESVGFDTLAHIRLFEDQYPIHWQVPGAYNAENGSVALTVVREVTGKTEDAVKAMETYQGIARRMELVYSASKHLLIDDYAHHPEEIKAFASAMNVMFPSRKKTVIFQPHLYTRTRDHFSGFAETLSMFDQVIILPIYPARELPIAGVTSEMIAKQLTTHGEAIEHKLLKTTIEKYDHDIIITLGAGNLDKHHQMLIEWIDKQT